MVEPTNTKDPLKVSFCTTCMGRLEHLKQTLPQNLANNADYENVEFVILAYGDRKTFNWVRANYAEEIESGTIKLAFSKQDHFRMAHAKNMAHRLASGHVLVNLDADNIAGQGFADWLDKQYKKKPNSAVRPRTIGRSIHMLTGGGYDRGIWGRIAVPREIFKKTHGYNENYVGWGADDTNFFNRALANGAVKVPLLVKHFGNTLDHSNEMRTSMLDDNAKEESWMNLAKSREEPIYKKAIKSIYGDLTGGEKTEIEELEGANPDGSYGCGEVSVINPELKPLMTEEKLTLLPESHAEWLESYQNIASGRTGFAR